MSGGFTLTAALAFAETGDAAHAGFFADPKLWVAFGFFVFLALLGYLGVHRKITKGLDERAAKIRGELDEARTLKEEAQHLLAQNQRQQREAAQNAEAIIEHAREEAKIIGQEVKSNIDILIERRTKLAEDRIAQAHTTALNELRSAAVDIAARAASEVIGEQLKGSKKNTLIEEAISSAGQKLH